MDEETPEIETLGVPHPMQCTLAELREAQEVYRLDLISEVTTGSIMSIGVLEGLAFIAYRRQGLPRAKAKAAASQIRPEQVQPDERPALLEEDGTPNPTSSVAS